MRSQKFDLLSGGEKTRINLARIILEQTDVLLLDEPTNHLDMDAVDWLGNYLENYRGTVLIISHDRWFIDQCCDRVIEIHDCTCDFYNGNYSYYAVERERAVRNSSSTTSMSWPRKSVWRRPRVPCTSTAPSIWRSVPRLSRSALRV